MKRIFCLLLTVIISAGVTGCAETPAAGINDSEGVVPVESIEIVVGDDEGAASVVGTAGAEENVFERVEGTFEYKGITFMGNYGHNSFTVSTDFLKENEEGKRICQISYDAIMAYLTDDVELILECFDKEKYSELQFSSMEGVKRRMDRLAELVLQTVSFHDVEGDNITLWAIYTIALNTNGDDFIYISTNVNMHLNDNDNWKVDDIFTGDVLD